MYWVGGVWFFEGGRGSLTLFFSTKVGVKRGYTPNFTFLGHQEVPEMFVVVMLGGRCIPILVFSIHLCLKSCWAIVNFRIRILIFFVTNGCNTRTVRNLKWEIYCVLSVYMLELDPSIRFLRISPSIYLSSIYLCNLGSLLPVYQRSRIKNSFIFIVQIVKESISIKTCWKISKGEMNNLCEYWIGNLLNNVNWNWLSKRKKWALRWFPVGSLPTLIKT